MTGRLDPTDPEITLLESKGPSIPWGAQGRLFYCLCGEDTGEGPEGEDLRGVYLPTKPHHVALLRTLVFVSRPLAPSHVEAYRSSVKVVHRGGVRGDELALRSLGIFDDPRSLC